MNLQDWIQILMGYLGSLGFNILFNIRGRKLFIASLGGFISWTVFLLLEPLFPGEAIRYFLAAAAFTLCHSVTVTGIIFALHYEIFTTAFAFAEMNILLKHFCEFKLKDIGNTAE